MQRVATISVHMMSARARARGVCVCVCVRAVCWSAVCGRAWSANKLLPGSVTCVGVALGATVEAKPLRTPVSMLLTVKSVGPINVCTLLVRMPYLHTLDVLLDTQPAIILWLVLNQ
jgi:hypothetical protein